MITKEEIQKLADLARISLSDNEKESLRKDIDGILEYVGQIKQVKVPVGEVWEPAERNVMREDVVTTESGSYKESLIDAAPQHERGLIKVKKIL
ncbi:MAG TPA: Asp-tRNA(Asn)/Glu-tRNA(Gln) amidotransferase subunit GatC [Candidatus Paceibacterota bacterium]